jgi:protein TonB
MVHLVLLGVMLVAAQFWSTKVEKAYVVNLVPAVAAVGVPQGRQTPVAPPAPPRVEEPPKRTEEPKRPEEPVKRVEEAPKAAPRPPAELPRREPAREMPARDVTARVPARLPESTLPPRTPAPPRPSDKELPSVSSPTTSRLPSPSAPAIAPPTTAPVTPRQETPPPAPPIGSPTGSPQGVGAVTLNVSDFPHAWYMREVQRKIGQKWDSRARDGQQPVAVFQIGRDGQVSGLAIEKTSGNALYDLSALRAITEASPFPPLPSDFQGSWLRVHLGFGYAGTPG